jgi:hypothetical protein
MLSPGGAETSPPTPQWVPLVLRPHPVQASGGGGIGSGGMLSLLAAPNANGAAFIAALCRVSEKHGYGGDVPVFVPLSLASAAIAEAAES